MTAYDVIGEKFKEYTDDHNNNRRWVSVKGKMPVVPGTDTPIKWKDPENRYTWEQIQKIPGDFGIILNKTGLSCLDFDKCLNEQGTIITEKQNVQGILEQLNTFTEISSSGRGLHAWIVTDANTKNEKPGTYELITDGHVKVTGNPYPPYMDKPIQMVESERLREILKQTVSKKQRSTGTGSGTITAGARNDTLFRKAAALRAKGLPESGILESLKAENQERCNPPLPDDEIATIAKSAANYPAGNIPPPDPETKRRAEEIYTSGNFINFCKENFAKVWLGDLYILEGVLYCAANMRVLNAKDGIHIHISGSTQTGKSDGIKTALQFIHPSDQQIKTFSKMYLFHASKTGDLHEKMIVFADDTVLDEEIAALYRNVLTSWFTGVERGTVINNTPQTQHIPARVSLILTSIESVVSKSDEGQDESRFLTLEVRRTPEQMAEIRKFIQGDRQDIKKERGVIYVIWDLITPREIILHKKIEKDIPIREFKRFLTLTQARALLCNRGETTDEDFDAIEKFLSYSKPMINSTTAAFTRKETAVRGVLSEKLMTVPEIVGATEMSIQDVYRALRGVKGTFQNPMGGLMAKEPRLDHQEEKSPNFNNYHLFRLRRD